MASIMICRDEQAARQALITLERHWLYEGREVHRSRLQGRDRSITFTLSGPLTPRLLGALEQIEGVEVHELTKIQRPAGGPRLQSRAQVKGGCNVS